MVTNEIVTMPPNKPPAPNPAIASQPHAGSHWRGSVSRDVGRCGTLRPITENENSAESFKLPVVELMRMQSPWRTNLRIAAIPVSLVIGVGRLYAAAFQNLDFEMATVTPAPAGYTPWDAFQPISAANALPYWTVREDATICSAVWGAPVALDETSVALVHGNTLSSLRMQSIVFLMQSPAVAGGVVQAKAVVTLNGTLINTFPLSTSAGVVTMAGDISAFAGTTANLSIECAGISGAPFNLNENIFELDAISFSSIAVPEPNMVSFVVLATLFALFPRVRQCRKTLSFHAAQPGECSGRRDSLLSNADRPRPAPTGSHC